METKQIQMAQETCNKFLYYGDYSLMVKDVFCQYAILFDSIQALYDAETLDPLNQKGMFSQVAAKIVQDVEADNCEFIPILVFEKEPKEVFEALDLLNNVLKKCYSELRLTFYSISLMIPGDKLERWNRSPRYLVTNSEHAKELKRRTLELLDDPGPKLVSPKIINEVKSSPETLAPRIPVKPKRINDPCKSDTFGEIQGAGDSGPRGLGLRRKR